MNAQLLTIELESWTEDYTEAQILLGHPFIQDIYYRYNWKDGAMKFDPLWSCCRTVPDNGNEVCLDFIHREIEKYEEQRQEGERYDGVGPYAYFGVKQSDFY